VLTTGEGVEVPDIEALVTVAVEAEQALDLGHRGPFGRGRLAAAIEQAVIAMVLQAPPQPPNAPRAAPEDLGRLDPGQLPVQGSHDHLVGFHRTLHSAGRIGHGHLLGGHSFHRARLKRSCHGSLPSGQITYPYPQQQLLHLLTQHRGQIIVLVTVDNRVYTTECRRVDARRLFPDARC
jgi:hypothetical protein